MQAKAQFKRLSRHDFYNILQVYAGGSLEKNRVF